MSLVLPPPRPAAGTDALAATLKLLRVADELMRSLEIHATGRFGLSRGRLGVLLWLESSADAGLRPAELADRLRVTRATISVLLDPEAEDGGKGQPYRTLGTFALFPQLNGSTQVQVIRFSDSTAEIDQALVNLWKEARAWMLEQANGQPAPQRARAAMPRRVSTS